MGDADFDALRLGEDSEPVRIDTSAGLRAASVALVRGARRKIEILSRHLDPPIYDNVEFCDAVRRFVLDSRRARVHIIVMDSAPILRDGHRLIELAQRLSSYIDVRKPGPSHASFNRAILLADRIGCIERELADRLEATVNFNDRRTAMALGDTFDEIWSNGQPDPNLRRLRL